MCGLVGGTIKNNNGFNYSDTTIVDQLLYMDALRGDDATGAAVFHHDGEMEVFKVASEAAFVRYLPEYQELLKRVTKKGKTFVGHNRKKTVGGSLDEDAHPFLIDNKYAFVHNGTLTNTWTLENGLAKNLEEIGASPTVPQTKVDSEVLGIMLTKCDGDIGKLETMLGKVNGAYACVWIDQENETLYMVRNSERPLWLATTSIGYFWASEQAMLYAVLGRNRLKIEECVQIDVDTLYSFDLNEKSEMLKEALTVKKALPPTTVATTKGGITTTTSGVGETKKKSISKTFFKKLQKRLGNTSIDFVIDDYVEIVPGDPASGWHVWGYEDGNEILCRAKLPGMTEEHLLREYGDCYCTGTVDTMVFNDQHKYPIIFVKDLGVLYECK